MLVNTLFGNRSDTSAVKVHCRRDLILLAAAAAAAVICAPPKVRATSYTATWTATSGNWTTPSDWSGIPAGLYPNNDVSNVYNVDITDNLAGGTADLTAAVTVGSVSLSIPALPPSFPAELEVDGTGASLNAASLNIGDDGKLVLDNGGIATVNGNAVIGGNGVTFNPFDDAPTTMTVTGTLTNNSSIAINGVSSTAGTPTLTVGSLVNNGAISLGGFSNSVKLIVNSAAPTDLTGSLAIGFGEVDFTGGGAITGLAPGANLALYERSSVISGNSTAQYGALANLSNIASGSTLTVAGGAVVNLNDSLSNAGTVVVNGAVLNLAGQAPGTLSGNWEVIESLWGNGQLGFSGGTITSLGSNANLTVNGANAEVTTGSGNALSSLANLNGGSTLELDNGVDLSLVGNLTTATGSITNLNYGISNVGGVTLTVNGTLTNNGGINLNPGYGNAANTALTAAALVNNGGIEVGGGNNGNRASVLITGTAPSTISGSWTLNGQGLVDYEGGGSIATLAPNTKLFLYQGGYMASGAATTSNSALTTLTTMQSGSAIYMYGGVNITTTTSLTMESNTLLWVDGPLAYGGGATLNVGGVLTGSGTITIGNINLTSPINVSANGLNNSGTLTILGQPGIYTPAVRGSLYINGQAQNSGSVSVQLGGMVTVAPGYNYTQTAGSTFVQSQGEIVAGTVNILGGTLTGSGTILGNVDNLGGTVGMVGANGGPAALTVDGNFTQGPGGALVVNINGSTQGAYDLLSVSGTVSLGGTLEIITGQTFNPYNGEQLVIIDPTGLSGQFNGITGLQFGLNNSDSWNISYLSNQVVLTASVPTPEPAALSLLTLGALSLLYRRNLRRPSPRVL